MAVAANRRVPPQRGRRKARMKASPRKVGGTEAPSTQAGADANTVAAAGTAVAAGIAVVAAAYIVAAAEIVEE